MSGAEATFQNPTTVRIKLSEPALIDDLVRYLERCDVRARATARHAINLDGDPSDSLLGTIRLDGYLRVWCSMHPGVAASLEEREATPQDKA